MSIQPRVIYDTTRYENRHGTKPRGYGVWQFAVTSSDGFESPPMNYGEAKRWFHNEISPMCGNGDDTITVSLLP